MHPLMRVFLKTRTNGNTVAAYTPEGGPKGPSAGAAIGDTAAGGYPQSEISQNK